MVMLGIGEISGILWLSTWPWALEERVWYSACGTQHVCLRVFQSQCSVFLLGPTGRESSDGGQGNQNSFTRCPHARWGALAGPRGSPVIHGPPQRDFTCACTRAFYAHGMCRRVRDQIAGQILEVARPLSHQNEDTEGLFPLASPG